MEIDAARAAAVQETDVLRGALADTTQKLADSVRSGAGLYTGVQMHEAKVQLDQEHQARQMAKKSGNHWEL